MNVTVPGEKISEDLKEAMSIVILIICGTSLFIGVPGNIWVLMKIGLEEQLRNIRFLLVSKQALVDLTICVTLAGSRILVLITDGAYSKLRCQVLEAFYGVSEVVSPMVLTLIAIERYIITMMPFQRATYLTRNNKALALALLWIVTLGMTFLIFKGSDFRRYPNSTRYTCEINLWGPPEALGAFIIASLFYVLPAMSQIILYSGMTKKSFTEMHSSFLQRNGSSRNKSMYRVSLMFLLASLNFILLRFLNALNQLWYVWDVQFENNTDPYSKGIFYYIIWSIGIPLVYMCSAITPWIYVSMSPIMRRPYFTLCNKKPKRNLKRISHLTSATENTYV